LPSDILEPLAFAYSYFVIISPKKSFLFL